MSCVKVVGDDHFNSDLGKVINGFRKNHAELCEQLLLFQAQIFALNQQALLTPIADNGFEELSVFERVSDQLENTANTLVVEVRLYSERLERLMSPEQHQVIVYAQHCSDVFFELIRDRVDELRNEFHQQEKLKEMLENSKAIEYDEEDCLDEKNDENDDDLDKESFTNNNDNNNEKDNSTEMHSTAVDAQNVEMAMFTDSDESLQVYEREQQQSAVVTLVTSSEFMLFINV